MSFRCRSLGSLQACLAVLCGVGSLLFGAATARAQTPPSGVQIVPYRLTIAGPANAAIGDLLKYEVRTEVVEPNKQSQTSVILWFGNDASLVSILNEDGESVDLGPFGPPNSRRVIGPIPVPGRVTATLRVDPLFRGDLRVGIYETGSGLQYPAGSVFDVVTHVGAADVATAPATGPTPAGAAPSRIALPSTGTATSTDDRSVRNFLLVGVIGAILWSCGAYVARSRTRAT